MSEPRVAQPRRGLQLCIAGFLIALQIALAFVALTEPRPARYGWQMYSSRTEMPQVWAIDGDAVRRIFPADALVNGRADLDWISLVRDRGCELTDADEVRFRLPDGTEGGLRCR